MSGIDSSNNSLPVVVLAGGLGTRLRSVVSDRPKILAPIGDRLFIHYLFDWLTVNGVSHVYFSLGYKSDQVQSELNCLETDIKINVSVEDKPLGTLGGLSKVLNEFELASCLVINGDTFVDLNVMQFSKESIKKKYWLSMVVNQLEDTSRYGAVTMDETNRIIQFQEKGIAGEGWINSGVYYLSGEAVDQLKAYKEGSLEKDFFGKYMAHIYGYKNPKSNFIDIGTPESYSQAEGVLKAILQ